MLQAYFDRLTSNGQAVLLVEATKETIHIAKHSLPQNCQPGDWLHIQMDGQRVTFIEKDFNRTATIQTDIDQKFAKLRKRKSSKFKRS